MGYTQDGPGFGQFIVDMVTATGEGADTWKLLDMSTTYIYFKSWVNLLLTEKEDEIGAENIEEVIQEGYKRYELTEEDISLGSMKVWLAVEYCTTRPSQSPRRHLKHDLLRDALSFTP